MARELMFRLHSGTSIPLGETQSRTVTGDNTVFPVLETVIVHVAVPPEETVWFSGVFATRIAGARGTTVTLAEALYITCVPSGAYPIADTMLL
jgi:hypothetical protein